MEQGPTEKDIIERCIRERRPFPDAIQNAPDLNLGSELFYIAFMDLSSSRSAGHAIPGPIPWHAIQLYCDAHDIEGEQREDVFYHVQHLDKSYLDWSAKKHKKDLAAANPPKPPKGAKKP
ncbi:hypothetical protein AXL3_14 [Stenotrophomonas phage vB_SmaS-AXL_3]|uniref:Tail chaperonin n=1 Tax=Stenotrophomonas phage vB_SmaS-AXL_3 TaxID=2740427 RepID=A0A7D5BY75_9CAUD|nr:tail chaperonin [Stenotrophomonas phage vB_SmaS-AXL_3]QKW95604.1 hypothetical protein AXL3_14 [Stenotrophomonas phage vB_SmaS-AXL_3]